MSKWIIGTLQSSLKLWKSRSTSSSDKSLPDDKYSSSALIPMRCGITSVSNVVFRPPSHFLAIRAVTGVVFGARLLGRLIS